MKANTARPITTGTMCHKKKKNVKLFSIAMVGANPFVCHPDGLQETRA